MVGSKSNKVALFASAFLVIVLVLFAILRDNSDSITLKEATKILGWVPSLTEPGVIIPEMRFDREISCGLI